MAGLGLSPPLPGEWGFPPILFSQGVRGLSPAGEWGCPQILSFFFPPLFPYWGGGGGGGGSFLHGERGTPPNYSYFHSSLPFQAERYARFLDLPAVLV